MAEEKRFAKSLEEVAKHFGVSETVLRRWKDKGCPHLDEKPYDLRAIAEWLQPQTQEKERWRVDARLKVLGVIVAVAAPVIAGLFLLARKDGSKPQRGHEAGAAKPGGEMSLDDELMGKTLDEARVLVARRKMTLRVMMEDGKSLLGTLEENPNRVDVGIRNGRIIRVQR